MAFVVSAGQLAAIQRPYAFNGYRGLAPLQRSVSVSPSLSQTYEQLWRSQIALRTTIDFLAVNVAQLSLDPYRRLTPTDREKATDHPLARLLERPAGSGAQWTKYKLLHTTMTDLCLFDDAYWLKMGEAGTVTGLQPIPPRWMAPFGGSMLKPEGYLLTGPTGKFRELKPEQVVHFRGYNPEDPRIGCAPAESLRMILAEEYAASVYREQMWRNGARLAGYITRPKDAVKWSAEARARFSNDWRAQYTGDSLATGGTPVFEDGMAFQPSGVTPKDAQYVEARKLTREEVAIAYHVPPAMLGIMEGVNFSSITEMHKMLYQDTLAPYLVRIAQDIEAQLLDDMDPSSRDGSVYVEFNLSSKLNGSFAEQAQAMQSAVGGPWMTRAEARAMHNLPSVEGADELIVPMNVTAGGLASPNDTAPDNPSNEASNGQPPKHDTAGVLRSFFARQGKAMVSRLGAGYASVDNLFRPERWDTELSTDLRDADRPIDARAVNAATRADLVEALKEADPLLAVRELFTRYQSTRADVIAHEWETAS